MYVELARSHFVGKNLIISIIMSKLFKRDKTIMKKIYLKKVKKISIN